MPRKRRVVAMLLAVCVLTACTGAEADGGTGASTQPTGTAESSATAEPAPSDDARSTAPAVPIAPSEGFATADIALRGDAGQDDLTVWVADTRPLRQRGLMERTSLPADAGMLFVFEGPTSSGFWMKNTLIPLSIAFIDDDGRVLEILDMEPCEDDPCPLYSPGVAYRYALEVNQGFYAERGITADWSLDIGGALGAS